MSTKENFSLIVFDLDGTLVDSYQPITESLNYVRAHFGLPPYKLAEVRSMVGHGLETLLEDCIGADNVVKGVELFREFYARTGPKNTVLLDGVKEVLPVLFERGYTIAIASNKPAYFTREIIASLGISQFFASVLGPECVRHPKPHPEMVETLMDEFGAKKENVVVIGDMRVDIETARSADVTIWAIPTGSESYEALSEAKPDRIIENFKDLLRLLPPLKC